MRVRYQARDRGAHPTRDADAEHGLDDVARAFGTGKGPQDGPGLLYHEHHDDQEGARLLGVQGKAVCVFGSDSQLLALGRHAQRCAR
eukprot:796333-Pyramimonas_sp.AAC.1